MKFSLIHRIALIGLCQLTFGQNKMEVRATFDTDKSQAKILQYIEYKNTSNTALDTVYFNDWSNSFSTKKTPLALRFAEEYDTGFFFAKNEERGFTTVFTVTDHQNKSLNFEHLKAHPDVLEVALDQPLLPGESYKVTLSYLVQFPDDKFTRYGVNAAKEFKLKYWYITPSVYDGKWHYYSNYNLDDIFIPATDLTMQIEYPKNYVLTSELDLVNTVQNSNSQSSILTGKSRVDSKLFLSRFPRFKTVQTDNFSIVSNIPEKNIGGTGSAIVTDRITQFITKHLGQYPHNKLLVTDIDVAKDPIYGLNQLPKFIRPFPDHFQYELNLLKSTLSNYLDNILLINPRTEYWLKDGVQIYFLMKYIDEFYPDMKLLGSLADVWGFRAFHAADLSFNDQYGLIYMHMARTNRDQRLTMPKDSLLKFNKNLAGKYKAGVGLKYLDDFINSNVLETTLKEYLVDTQLKKTSPKSFETAIRSNTSKNLDWFFEEYLNTRNKIDYRIKDLSKTEDSITFTVQNKRKSTMPVSLFTLKDDSIISKTWLTGIKSKITFTIPRDSANKLVLNYDNRVPEYNLRDNWKSLKGFFFNNRPLQFRVFKDVEDPYYNQVFLMPIIEYRNIYDGLTLGLKFYNKTLLRKGFNYKISPKYSFASKTLTGGASVSNIHNIDGSNNLYSIAYGVSGSYSSYAPDLFIRKLTPFLSFNFRDNSNFRSNKFQSLNIRYIDISKDPDLLNISNNSDPDYKVFNMRYVNTNPGLIKYDKWFTDFQLSESFGKIAFNYEYRKLFDNNHHLGFRFYAGTFLYNKTNEDSDYFSFALDRPTDYLFDYNYLGRSENSGIFSQQLIIAEGGFKSKLEPAFANQWMTTMNFTSSIWRYIQTYGDIGLVQNKNTQVKFVYDAGIRLSLVADYFEIYFPVYSNLGWEIGQPQYDQKIRFIFTMDPQSLLGLFRRKWY